MIGIFVILVVLGLGGTMLPIPHTEISQQKPFNDFIGREYRVIGPTYAMYWNDFPDKEKILTVSIASARTKNRFVTKIVPLQVGQRIRIVSAWHYWALIEYIRYYKVSVTDLDSPAGVPIQMDVKSNGIPDPLIYEPISQ